MLTRVRFNVSIMVTMVAAVKVDVIFISCHVYRVAGRKVWGITAQFALHVEGGADVTVDGGGHDEHGDGDEDSVEVDVWLDGDDGEDSEVGDSDELDEVHGVDKVDVGESDEMGELEEVHEDEEVDADEFDTPDETEVSPTRSSGNPSVSSLVLSPSDRESRRDGQVTAVMVTRIVFVVVTSLGGVSDPAGNVSRLIWGSFCITRHEGYKPWST